VTKFTPNELLAHDRRMWNSGFAAGLIEAARLARRRAKQPDLGLPESQRLMAMARVYKHIAAEIEKKK
jgi:hypothetical protein